MTLAEICRMLATTPAPVLHGLAVPHPRATEIALRMLARMIGVPIDALDLPPPQFAQRFPRDRIPAEARPTFGADLRRYRSWRRLVLDVQMLGCRLAVDPDPWESLRRAARLVLGETKAATLYALGKHVRGRAPNALTLANLVAVEDQLHGKERQSFRRACAVLVGLHGHDLPRVAGLLPPCLGPLPRRSRLPDLLPLPPRLAAAATETPTLTVAAAYAWTLAVRIGLVEAGTDPVGERALDRDSWRRLAAVHPAAHGFALSAETWALYLGRFARLLAAAGMPDPRCDRPQAAWRDLMACVRATGRSTEALSPLAQPAKRAGLAPADLTASWIAERIAATPKGARRNGLRRACLCLDALRDDPAIPDKLLPPAATGVVRLRGRTRARPEPIRRPPVEQAWVDFLAELRRLGFGEGDLNCLSAIRGHAIAGGLRPRDLDRDWIDARRAGRPHWVAAKISMAARLLDRVRCEPGLRPHLPDAPIGPLADRRRSAGALPPAVAGDLADLLEALGAAASTRREASIAVRALADAVGRSGRALPDTLRALLDLERAGLDWGPHGARARDHGQVLDRLRAHLALPWTAEWRALQRALVEAGVPMRDNPLAALLSEARGRSPRALDTEWARAVVRRHRAAGRADLARTFEANIVRLDALHAIPALAAAGLLPPRLGPVRPGPSLDGGASAPG